MSAESPINPIIPGFAPDPSLVLVDDTYFLVNSTFHLFPGLPIYTSRDLVHWHQIGNAINRSSQLSFSKGSTLIHGLGNNDHLYATGGLYAPTLRHHNGTFYIVCTNVVNHGKEYGKESETQNFIISSTDIYANKWSDPVYFDFDGIDPSLFFDPHSGKAYLCGSKSPGPETKITLFEIDVATGKKLSDEKQLWHGTGGIYPEGPHIYLRNDFYYLMIAEGGTHEGHAVTMARSKSLDGPWEPSPLNPILSAAGTNEYVQCTGHCEAFEAKDGQWWGVCLGIRMREKELYGLGRETFLTKASWTSDGWLKFDRASMLLQHASLPPVDATKKLTAAPHADFLYIHDPVLENYKIASDAVTLTASPHDLASANASPSFVGKRQRRMQGTSTATLLVPPSASTKLTAGIAVYKDEHRFLSLSYTASPTTPALTLHVVNTAKGINRSQTSPLERPPTSIEFTISYSETRYQVFYQTAGAVQGQRTQVGPVDALEISGTDFVGPVVGLFAVGEHVEVAFESFDVHGA